jgi:capsular polysaccharide biosynthesis protein
LHNAQLNGKGHAALMSAEPYTGAPTEAGTSEDEVILSLGDLLRVIWRRLWVILLVAAVLTGAAVGLSFLQTPMYEGSIKVLVGQEQRSDVPSNLGSDVVGLQQLTQTMAEAVNTLPVAEAVIEELDLRTTPEEFLENLSVQQVAETQFIEVSYTDPSPQRAQQVANAIGDEFSARVSEISPSANAITATVWERAATPDSPASPDPVRNGLLALVLGLMLGVGLAFLLEYRDDSWRSPEEVEQVSGVPTFGIIPEFKGTKNKKKGV